MFCLDNRIDARSWYTSVASSYGVRRVTFGQFLAVLALFEWSLATLDVITFMLNMSTDSVLDCIPIVQAFAAFLLKDMPDPSRVSALMRRLDGLGRPVSHLPLCAKARCIAVFSHLLFEWDMPRLALQTNTERARTQIDHAVRDFIVKLPEGDAFIGTAIASGLIAEIAWSNLVGSVTDSYSGLGARVWRRVQNHRAHASNTLPTSTGDDLATATSSQPLAHVADRPLEAAETLPIPTSRRRRHRRGPRLRGKGRRNADAARMTVILRLIQIVIVAGLFVFASGRLDFS